VRLHIGERSLLMRDTLANLETRLDPARFVRVHRRLIVQLARVTSAESLPAGEYVLRLASGRSIRSGRTYRPWVQAAFAIKP
jgi:DNA-binding LytR/AlgR family response regulator